MFILPNNVLIYIFILQIITVFAFDHNVCNLSGRDKRRTMLSAPSLNPEWHRTLVISDIAQRDIAEKTLEVSVWSGDQNSPKLYLGEVLLDFSGTSFVYYIFNLFI